MLGKQLLRLYLERPSQFLNRLGTGVNPLFFYIVDGGVMNSREVGKHRPRVSARSPQPKQIVSNDSWRGVCSFWHNLSSLYSWFLREDYTIVHSIFVVKSYLENRTSGRDQKTRCPASREEQAIESLPVRNIARKRERITAVKLRLGKSAVVFGGGE